MKSDTRRNNNAALLESYVSAYRSIHAKSCFTIRELDVVLLSMFFEKACLYCMDAHKFVSGKVYGTEAVQKRGVKEDTEIPETKLKALSAFSRAVASSKGYSKAGIKHFFSSGYSEKQLLCVIAIHGILTWNNFFSRIYEEPLTEVSQKGIQDIGDIKTLELITLAS